MFSFFEFFAGGGMVRAGLGPGWRCLFANDVDPKKAQSYIANWGDAELTVADVRSLTHNDLPSERPDLVWGSFPCQDLSLAGAGAGLEGERSGTFWPFWRLVVERVRAGAAPSVIVLENVAGALTSDEGRGFESIIDAFADIDFHVGAMLVDAMHFVPQSRPRLFFVGTPRAQAPQCPPVSETVDLWRSASLKRAYLTLPARLKKRWIWWTMPVPPTRNARFADLIEDDPIDVKWHAEAETRRHLRMMSPPNLAKVEQAQAQGRRMVGAMYRRMRRLDGKSVQRVEVRFDDVAGCLRTPAGGSSRQLLLIVEGDRIRSRLMSARETARLMGLEDAYRLPENYNEAYHLTGDGVVVNVVKYLAENVLEPHLRRIAGIAGKTSRSAGETPAAGKAGRAGKLNAGERVKQRARQRSV